MRKFAACIASLALALTLAACADGGGRDDANRYLLYYPAAELQDQAGADALITRSVVIGDAASLTTDELARRLVERLLADPDDPTVVSPVPGGTTLSSLSVLGKWARVDFSRHYARLAGVDLTIADYCITLTLTQLDGVNAVSITSGGVELPYRKTQTLTAADPLLSTQEDARRPVTVSLFFLDPSLPGLCAERQALTLYEGQTRVNALLDALLRGPESAGLLPLLPEGFAVSSAREEDGTCYLNLPAGTELGDSPRLAVDSLVLSLCSLDNIEWVQLVVDGEIVPELCGVEIGGPLHP